MTFSWTEIRNVVQNNEDNIDRKSIEADRESKLLHLKGVVKKNQPFSVLTQSVAVLYSSLFF